MGTGLLVGTFVDIGHADSLAILHQALAARLVHHRIRELDGAAIRAQAPREFTQEVSRHIYERALDGGAAFAGIHYQSRMGDNLHNWAIFERPGALAIRPGPSEQITELDADFLRALDLLGLTLQP
jgi:hypothetical protein